MIHETAIIGKNVKISENVEIGPYCVIGNNTFIGKNTKIYSHACIGTHPEHLRLDLKKYKDNTTTYIGKNVTIREYCTVNSGMPGSRTVIKDNVYLMTKSHIGHDAVINESCVISSGAKIGGHSIIGAYSYVGLNASTHQHSYLGKFCMIGAQGFYKNYNTVDGITWAGVPCRPIKINFHNINKNAENKELVIENADSFLKKEQKTRSENASNS